MNVTKALIVAAVLAPMIAVAQPARKKTPPPPAGNPPPPAQQPHHPRHESLHDQLSGQGYGMAGCGLGSIVFGAKPGIIQVVAATTNNYFFPQTFAITTGTSNCDIPVAGQQAAVFIEVNREILAKDASRGQGETVEGLASILHCEDTAAFGQGLQSNFEQIFKKENDSYNATRAIISTIKSNPSLEASCHVG